MRSGMGPVRRFFGVWTIVVGEYLAAAALLVALVFLAAAIPPRRGCADSCNSDSLGLALFAIAGLALLVVGLPVALALAALRRRRQRQRASAGRPTVRRGQLAEATIAAVWGVAVAVPLSSLTCILAVPVLRLLR